MPDNDSRFPVRSVPNPEAAEPLSSEPRPAGRSEKRITLVSFPGGAQHIPFPSGKVSLRMVLTRAGVRPEDFDNAEVAINNTVTTDYDLIVPDDAIITRTARVEGGSL